MTRLGILRILVHQAGKNGFNFRKWYEERIGLSWTSHENALLDLSEGRHYYALLFSHEFARFFWKEGSKISFIVPGTSYTKRGKGGKIITVSRKAFTRRTTKADVWKYHLREMSAHDEPLRYIRRFLMMEEDLVERKPSVEVTTLRRVPGQEAAGPQKAFMQAEEMGNLSVPLANVLSRQ